MKFITAKLKGQEYVVVGQNVYLSDVTETEIPDDSPLVPHKFRGVGDVCDFCERPKDAGRHKAAEG